MGVMKNLAALLAPGGVLVLAALVCLRPGGLPAWMLPYARAYPYVVFGVGVLLGWCFHRSRIVFALLVLAVADRSLLVSGAGEWGAMGVGRVVFDAVALALPLNLVWLAVISERGILTRRGVTRLVSILVQVVAIAAMLRVDRHVLSTGLEYAFLNMDLTTWTPIAQPALLAFAAAAVLHVVRLVLSRNPMEAGFFWVVVSAFLALHGIGWGWAPTNFLATGGLVLVVALVATSYRMAYHDELTGLPGRRALNEFLLTLGSRYAVAMVDIDHFKRFNDTYGHEVGDQVLRMVASRLGGVSGEGKAFRYGGEEFSVIFPGKSAAEAVPHLESLREAVAASRFVVRNPGRPRRKPAQPKAPTRPGREVAVRVSIGVAGPADRNAGPPQVVKAADRALYRAKHAGRNRVMR
ncbi:MAG TPA: GGDEF domain-containing protein [Candidatus Methylomirabilis sp.]|nr:GGDEF domain-containing protein [Candidatus Methylomirabilis sp.]